MPGENGGGWLGSALDLIGDVIDPFLPGFAGSEGRPTSSTVTLADINAQRKAAGLPPLRHRHRRKRALSHSDKADIAFIAATVSKKAAGDLAVMIASH